METVIDWASHGSIPSPHSLGKLIEWKRVVKSRQPSIIYSPHSLGKLIEWKHDPSFRPRKQAVQSPLAGETN